SRRNAPRIIPRGRAPADLPGKRPEDHPHVAPRPGRAAATPTFGSLQATDQGAPMSPAPSTVARRRGRGAAEAGDGLGRRVRFLTPREGPDEAPCLMEGTMPPGGVVPLHAHADPETFVPRRGTME